MVGKYAWLEQCFSCYDRLHEIRYFQYFISFSWNHIFLKKISIYKETISLLFSKFITRRRLKKLKKKIVHNGIPPYRLFHLYMLQLSFITWKKKNHTSPVNALWNWLAGKKGSWVFVIIITGNSKSTKHSLSERMGKMANTTRINYAR